MVLLKNGTDPGVGGIDVETQRRGRHRVGEQGGGGQRLFDLDERFVGGVRPRHQLCPFAAGTLVQQLVQWSEETRGVRDKAVVVRRHADETPHLLLGAWPRELGDGCHSVRQRCDSCGRHFVSEKS